MDASGPLIATGPLLYDTRLPQPLPLFTHNTHPPTTIYVHVCMHVRTGSKDATVALLRLSPDGRLTEDRRLEVRNTK